jgi:hypothetical protein
MYSTTHVLDAGFDGANFLFWLTVHLVCTAVVLAVARHKGLPLKTWIPLGLFFGVFTVIGALMVRPQAKEGE